MSTTDFITELFCRVDDQMHDVKQHSQAKLHPSEIATLAMLYTWRGGSELAFYRWLKRDCVGLFPNLPSRTRLFRLFKTHQDWAWRFMAKPTLFGVADTFGIELIKPIREGRSPRQIGRKYYSNKRWIVGVKLCVFLNDQGLVVDWVAVQGNVADNACTVLCEQWTDEMIVMTDLSFHRNKQIGDPVNLKLCRHGEWGERMVVERFNAQLTTVLHGKQMSQRGWTYLNARLGFMVAFYNLLAEMPAGLVAGGKHGLMSPHIAQFSF